MHDPRIEIATCNTSPSTVREYYDPNPAADRANWVSFAFRDEGTSTSQVYVHMQNGKYDGRTVAAGTKLDDIADGAAAIVAGEDVNGIWEHSATSFTLFCYDGVNLIKHPSDISTAHVEHINWNTVTE